MAFKLKKLYTLIDIAICTAVSFSIGVVIAEAVMRAAHHV